MSAQQVEEVIRRAETDPAFRQRLKEEPDRALHGFDITVAERQALVSGDAAKLQQLGISPEMSLAAAEINGSGSAVAEGE